MKDIQLIKANKTISSRRGVLQDVIRVAAYCRVSTDSEDQINSYNSQLQYYKDYISQKPEWNFAGIFADEAITGTKVDKRDGFRKMISRALNGEIDMIVTKSITRFARNTVDTLQYVRMLKEKCVEVYFEEENIRTLSMDGELLLTILSSVAQQEVENISAHVKKGLKMKMHRGEMIGLPRCLGYNFDFETNQMTVNDEEAKIVRYIFDRYCEGMGGQVIARELSEMGIPSPRGNSEWRDSTILKIIKNEKYVGDVIMGKTFTVDPISKRRLENLGEADECYIKDNHEPIISREQFEKAKEIREKRASCKKTVLEIGASKRTTYSRKYAFSSLLECGYCMAYCSRQSWHASSKYQKNVWQCMSATKKGKKYCPHSKAISEELIEEVFLESLRQFSHSKSNAIKKFLTLVSEELTKDLAHSDASQTRHELDKLEREERQILELHLAEKISYDIYIYIQKYDELQSKKIKLQEDVASFEQYKEEQVNLKDRIKSFERELSKHEIIDIFDRKIFEAVIEKIIVGGYTEEGEIDPYQLTIIYKSGEVKETHVKKSKNRNLKLSPTSLHNDEELYPNSPHSTNGSSCKIN